MKKRTLRPLFRELFPKLTEFWEKLTIQLLSNQGKEKNIEQVSAKFSVFCCFLAEFVQKLKFLNNSIKKSFKAGTKRQIPPCFWHILHGILVPLWQ
jgi:hypothetical protein